MLRTSQLFRTARACTNAVALLTGLSYFCQSRRNRLAPQSSWTECLTPRERRSLCTRNISKVSPNNTPLSIVNTRLGTFSQHSIFRSTSLSQPCPVGGTLARRHSGFCLYIVVKSKSWCHLPTSFCLVFPGGPRKTTDPYPQKLLSVLLLAGSIWCPPSKNFRCALLWPNLGTDLNNLAHRPLCPVCR